MSTEYTPIQRFIAMLFMSRDFAHKRHLAATGPGSYAEHKILNKFYEDVLDATDTFAEAWQGENLKLIGDIPYFDADFEGKTVDGLKKHLESLREFRPEVARGCPPMEALADEIEFVYLSALYKLTFLS